MSKIETLIETHAEHLRKLTIAELYDGTLGLLVRDALTTAKGFGAGEERENAARLCDRLAAYADKLHKESGDGDIRRFRKGEATTARDLAEMIRAGERAPTVEAEPTPDEAPPAWAVAAFPGDFPEAVEAFNEMEVKPPVEDANPWRRSKTMPQVDRPFEVRDGLDRIGIRRLLDDNRIYDMDGAFQCRADEFPSIWPEWRYIVEPATELEPVRITPTESDLNRGAIKNALNTAAFFEAPDVGRRSIAKVDFDTILCGLRIALSEHDNLTRKVANQAKALTGMNDAQRILKGEKAALETELRLAKVERDEVMAAITPAVKTLRETAEALMNATLPF